MFDAANQTRMHLDLKQVKALIAVLEQWVASGSFVEEPAWAINGILSATKDTH
jgi:hypothetical protein